MSNAGTDNELAETVSVTVCIAEEADKPAEQPRAAEQPAHLEVNVSSSFEQIGPPTRFTELQCTVDESILVRDLTQKARSSIRMRLNPPQIGSMKNWETVAILMGLAGDEVLCLRSSADPSAELFFRFEDVPLNRLLRAIRDAGRVDVMIALQHHLAELRRNAVQKREDQDSALYSTDAVQSTNAAAGSAGSDAPPTNPQLPQTVPPARPHLPQRFLLVTHHHPPEEKTCRARYDTVLANLKNIGKAMNTEIVDVDTCVNEQNIYNNILNVFNAAHHVILFVSKAYLEEIHKKYTKDEPNAPPDVQVKRTLESLMGQEFMANGMLVKRFTVIYADPADREHIPNGWPKVTLRYLFPDNWQDICKKVFKNIPRRRL